MKTKFVTQKGKAIGYVTVVSDPNGAEVAIVCPTKTLLKKHFKALANTNLTYNPALTQPCTLELHPTNAEGMAAPQKAADNQ